MIASRRLLVFLFLVFCAAVCPAAFSQHPFVCADYTGGKVFVVSSAGKIEWEYPAPNCNDLWILPNGNLLFTTGTGVREIARASKAGEVDRVVFNYDSPSKSEVFACQRLPNGDTFVGECTTGRLLEIAPDGRITHEARLALPPGKNGGKATGGHSFMRNARRLSDGGYLVAHYGLGVVREYDREGKLRREIPAAGGPHSVVRLPDGNTLVACADGKGGPQVFEITADDRVVWRIGKDELPGVDLKFLCGLQRLPNGNTVLTNWLGHNQLGKAPVVIEVTRDKRVVWTYANHAEIKTASSIQLCDVAGDVTRGEILH